MGLLQRWVRFFVLGFAAAAMPAIVHAESSAAGTGKGHLDFRIVVPQVVRVSGLTAPSEFTIDREDVGRGYVDVRPGAPVIVTSNANYGYPVTVAFDNAIASRVVVRIQEQRLSAERSGAQFVVAAPRMRNAAVAIGYRIFLAPAIAAGTYRWPVALRFGAAHGLP